MTAREVFRKELDMLKEQYILHGILTFTKNFISPDCKIQRNAKR